MADQEKSESGMANGRRRRFFRLLVRVAVFCLVWLLYIWIDRTFRRIPIWSKPGVDPAGQGNYWILAVLFLGGLLYVVIGSRLDRKKSGRL